MVRDCSEAGGSSSSAWRQRPSARDASPARVAASASAASRARVSAWTSRWQDGQLTIAGASSVPQRTQRGATIVVLVVTSGGR